MYVIAAVIAVWFALGLLAICACVAGGRAENRERLLEEERPDQEQERSRPLRAAMF